MEAPALVNERRVLFVAYHFPPLGGAGVQRSSKFVKYLPGTGWMPTVLSADDSHQVRDETLLEDIPQGVRVERVAVRPRRRQLLYDRLFAARLGRLVTWSRYVFESPDRFTRWDRDAGVRLEQLIREEKPPVLFSSSAPFASHLMVGRRAVKFAIPWVADFRDPWSDNPDLLGRAPEWVRGRHRRMERWVALGASHLVFAHPEIAESFKARYHLSGDMVSTIPNGFDPADFPKWNERGRDGRASGGSASDLVIAHVGTFYRSYNELPLLRAARVVANRSPRSLEGVTFHFVGGITGDFSGVGQANVRVHERQNHRTAIEWMKRANGLVLVIPTEMGGTAVPGKLFEYLAAQRPIFAICPRGTTSEWLAESGCGVSVSAANDEEAGLALMRFLDELKRGLPDWFRPRQDFIAQFSRETQARKLAAVFNDVSAPT